MEFPAQLDAKLQALLKRYPVKRSALVPILLYTQDHFGCITDEMIAAIAERLDLNTVQVTETLAYYSMLHRKPLGRYHLQMCTNVSCMLLGGYDVYHTCKRSSASAISRPRPTAPSRSKKWNAWAPAPARPACR